MAAQIESAGARGGGHSGRARACSVATVESGGCGLLLLRLSAAAQRLPVRARQWRPRPRGGSLLLLELVGVAESTAACGVLSATRLLLTALARWRRGGGVYRGLAQPSPRSSAAAPPATCLLVLVGDGWRSIPRAATPFLSRVPW
jgi:hypothetical protein